MSYIDTSEYSRVHGDMPDLWDEADWRFARLDADREPFGDPLVLPGSFENALAVVLGDRHPDWRLIP